MASFGHLNQQSVVGGGGGGAPGGNQSNASSKAGGTNITGATAASTQPQTHLQYQVIEHVLHGSVSAAPLPVPGENSTTSQTNQFGGGGMTSEGGTASSSGYRLLVERLKGCTDKFHEFFDHESHYILAQYGVAGSPSFNLKLRRSCLPRHLRHYTPSEFDVGSNANGVNPNNPGHPYQIRYQGMNDQVRDKSKSTITRTVITVSASNGSSGANRGSSTNNGVTHPGLFLEQLGFRLDFHVVTKGLVFIRNNIKVTLSRVYRVIPTVPDGSGNCDHLKETYSEKELQLMSGDKFLVEATATHPLNVPQEQVGEELRAFVDHLKPLVMMEKIEHR
ncbi:mediator of RNA polymerase II transcription subunit 18-like [Convolutriloba macropyga]|uniref:mediator of RNA polymerase II transcription subunit 18-like n=1 Tax=Convolutriloba macropyga TaxID=536237 RepID=UPI003F5273FF